VICARVSGLLRTHLEVACNNTRSIRIARHSDEKTKGQQSVDAGDHRDQVGLPRWGRHTASALLLAYTGERQRWINFCEIIPLLTLVYE
jgi:hypothetical protein